MKLTHAAKLNETAAARLRAFLKDAPPDEVWSTRELAQKSGIPRKSFEHLPAHDHVDICHRADSGRVFWGSPKAIYALRAMIAKGGAK